MAEILDGLKVSKEIKQEIKAEVEKILRNNGIGYAAIAKSGIGQGIGDRPGNRRCLTKQGGQLFQGHSRDQRNHRRRAV